MNFHDNIFRICFFIQISLKNDEKFYNGTSDKIEERIKLAIYKFSVLHRRFQYVKLCKKEAHYDCN